MSADLRNMLELLCCPKCHAALQSVKDQNRMTCTKCGRVYPIVNDIPIMLVEDEHQAPRS